MCFYDKELNGEFLERERADLRMSPAFELDKPILDGGHDLLAERNMMARATKAPS